MFMRNSDLQFSFPVLFFILVSESFLPHRINWEEDPPSFLIFCRSLQKISINSFLNVQRNSPVKPSKTGVFIVGRLTTNSIPFTDKSLILFLYFFLNEFGGLSLNEFVHFIYVVQFIGIIFLLNQKLQRSETLPYLQANKLAYHIVRYRDKDRDILIEEMIFRVRESLLLTAKTARAASLHQFPQPQSLQATPMRDRYYLCVQQGCTQQRNLKID